MVLDAEGQKRRHDASEMRFQKKRREVRPLLTKRHKRDPPLFLFHAYLVPSPPSSYYFEPISRRRLRKLLNPVFKILTSLKTQFCQLSLSLFLDSLVT